MATKMGMQCLGGSWSAPDTETLCGYARTCCVLLNVRASHAFLAVRAAT